VHKLFFFPAALLLTIPPVAGIAETLQSPAAVQTTPVYAQSKEGFRSQIDAIVQSYRAGGATTGRQLIDQLHLPHSEAWFSAHLPPEQSAKLTERYDRVFENFAESLEKTIETIVANRTSDLASDLDEGKGEKPAIVRPGTKLSGVVAVNRPNLFFCHFAITVKKQDSTSWADTFTYEDGAFRFLGFGGWPFWAYEDGSEGRAPNGGSFSEPPVLVNQVSPVYPAAAKLQRVQGIVAVRILIDKEGRVKKAEVVSGDPLLIQAALDAVRQWRYKPGTLGGAPRESDATVNVAFALSLKP
jgi:TonB family protein